MWKKIRPRPKAVLLFSGAIILPLIVVGALSFDAMSKRRASIDGLLEVNLLNTGRAAVGAIESELEMRERATLAGEFPPASLASREPTFRPFSLDGNFALILPSIATLGGAVPPIRGGKRESSLFDTFIAEAERNELIAKNMAAAAEAYRRAAHEATTAGGTARALNGRARCLANRNDYAKARDLWLKIAGDFSAAVDTAGHPYGLTAGLCSAEMDISLDNYDAAAHALISLWGKLRQGAWRLRPAAFAFFQSEIDALLKKIIGLQSRPDLESAYRNLVSGSTPFVDEMAFIDMLESAVIPEIESRRGAVEVRGAAEPTRFSLVWKGTDFLVSFRTESVAAREPAPVRINTPTAVPATAPVLHSEKSPLAIRGCCVASRVLVTSLLDRSIESGPNKKEYRSRLIGPASPAPSGNSEKPGQAPATFAFDRFPLPWKIALEAPSTVSARRTALRENVLLGLLLAAVFGLMLLGGFLLARDTARESEIARQKTEFVHNISHELKTPLTLIRLFGETLDRNRDLSDADRLDAYAIINRESERLSHLIDNVLDFSRIEMGRKEFDFGDADLAAIVRQTMDAYSKEFDQAGFDVALDVEKGLPSLRFDREAITGVLLNLLGNALKFSPHVKSLRVRLGRRGEDVVLEVEDRGVGIPAEDLPRIFDKFYRGGNKIVAQTSGSGLGLTLAKYIVEAHAGRIEVQSRPGEGSTFRIVLPIPVSRSEGPNA